MINSTKKPYSKKPLLIDAGIKRLHCVWILMGSVMESGHRTCLERLDAIIFEQNLKQSIERMIAFESHSIMFPRKNDCSLPSWIEDEQRLLLPIPDSQGDILGLFVARGVDPEKAKQILSVWEGVAPLVSENLLNYKKSLCDPVTGLFTRHYLLSVLQRDLDAMRFPENRKTSLSHQLSPYFSDIDSSRSNREDKSEVIPHGSVEDDDIASVLPSASSSAVLTIRLAALRDVVREYGYQFADELMVALADALLKACPEQAIAARTGDLEFAVLLRSATKKVTEKLATELVEVLGKTSIEHPLRNDRVGIMAAIGFAFFPHDLAGRDFLRPSAEQTQLFLRKARLAAALADEHDWNGTRRVMGFGQILSEGARITHVLPLSRLVVSIGSNMHAKEGQRFSVWSVQRHSQDGVTPLYKGEVVLMDVNENTSQAEVTHMGDPSWPIEKGDRLVLLPEEQGGLKHGVSSRNLHRDPATNLLRHGDFLAQWGVVREEKDSFRLALSRVTPLPLNDSKCHTSNEENSKESALLSRHPDQLMSEVASLFREEFGEDVLGGRYGLNSLVFFHPNLSVEQANTSYKKLAFLLKDRLQLQLAVGIAPHPFLNFRKSDALENCQKALEYALLLPSPHIGIIDSLALNISADKRFSEGDTFSAIREYQRALWADEKNALAWNSLGICYAGLGRLTEAEEYFSKALGCDPTDPMALYNLGVIFQSRSEKETATNYFTSCLEQAPHHLFALIRLGQMAEVEGDFKKAKDFFIKASVVQGGEGVTFRHFARLALAEGNDEDAREHLHSALLHDPQDAIALQMLARLYLDAGEDPNIALSLARQSVSLRPELKSGWTALARALESLGKVDQAREARYKSGQVE